MCVYIYIYGDDHLQPGRDRDARPSHYLISIFRFISPYNYISISLSHYIYTDIHIPMYKERERGFPPALPEEMAVATSGLE